MIVVLKHKILEMDKKNIINFLEKRGFQVRQIVGEDETVLGALGHGGVDIGDIQQLPGVTKVVPISKPYKLASREFHAEDSVVRIGDIAIGGNRIAIIAGPCSIESREQMMESAAAAAASGAVILRGGAFKPRTSPYAFQGLGKEGLKLLREAGDYYNMAVITEVVSAEILPTVSQYVDILQVGARNMQNFELLKKLGEFNKPVLLKRGLAATIEEWLMAAEYLLAHGTQDVILCERGIRTFEQATRNTLDLSALPVLKKLTHLPVLVDPSHATGRRDSVMPMALAAVSAGASGLIVEIHPHPEEALSDGPQALYPMQFEKLMRDIQVLAPVLGKELALLPKPIVPSKKSSAKGDQNGTIDLIEVGFQGEPGAYTEAALYQYFINQKYRARPYEVFRDVFNAVLSREVPIGVIPVENSLGGSVHQNYDLLFEYQDLHITGEIGYRVQHNLIGFSGVALKEIKEVYSHYQALAQSARFLDSLKGVKQIPHDDTSGAVKMIAEKGDRSCAAIASIQAAKLWGMSVLQRNIETNPKNYTRFFILERGEALLTPECTKVSLVFSVKDKPGALFKVLASFDNNQFNLKKLESRPILGKPWVYMFYLDIDLGDHPQEIFQVVDEMKENAENIRVLGFYKGA